MNTSSLKVLPVSCFVRVMNKAADTAVVGALGQDPLHRSSSPGTWRSQSYFNFKGCFFMVYMRRQADIEEPLVRA